MSQHCGRPRSPRRIRPSSPDEKAAELGNVIVRRRKRAVRRAHSHRDLQHPDHAIPHDPRICAPPCRLCTQAPLNADSQAWRQHPSDDRSLPGMGRAIAGQSVFGKSRMEAACDIAGSRKPPGSCRLGFAGVAPSTLACQNRQVSALATFQRFPRSPGLWAAGKSAGLSARREKAFRSALPVQPRTIRPRWQKQCPAPVR